MEHINELVVRYQNKGLLIDTNLLLLYFIGAYDPTRIPKFKRTMAFTIDEFWFLVKFLGVFNKLVTTPNVLTEVSNLSGQLAENLRFFYLTLVTAFQLEEHYVPAVSLRR